ncbi:FxSxx-COOH system tetratricopeptide repeat protein [Spongiactinospora sp. TRM90649]|uniref:FxSxx-COOH system tetratricopeptide repeat protein n=1 Tax=Spongiactinospora sp. TRM90649 TaxID=3031114 RepID=UPI0023F95B3C|nr:FxSxx-COOH system tetratricopeptide repeat protein [Spongiactinospora sp. TRM90649]
MPQQNRNFTGRSDLLEGLRRGLKSEVTAVVPFVPKALHGLGGVGKTQLAIEYAHRYRSEYDLVWWIPADQPMLVKSSLAGLARELRLPIAASAGVEDAADAVLDALRRGEPFDRWLLIFDNADDPEEMNDIVPRGPGHVLITSRNHSWQGVVDTLTVDVFRREESIEFLMKRVPRGISEEQADRLSDALGDLPLALEQAGALQVETGMSIDDYLRMLKEQTTRVLGANKPSDYPLSMTAAWALSVSQLAGRMPEAVELLRCCAFFGPEPIPRDLFDQMPEAFATGSRMGEMLADPIQVSRAIRELGRYALVRIDSENRTIHMHRLVQALLRDELDPAEYAAFRREVHLLLAATVVSYEADDNTTWPRYSGLLGHITPSQVAESRDPRIRAFALNIVRFLYSSGDFESSRELVESFIARWVADGGEDDEHVLSAQRHHAIIIRELGEIQQSFEQNQRLMVRMRQILGEDHRETLLLTNSHGADLRYRGEFAAALEHDKESLRRHQAVFRAGHRRTLRVMNNLALDYLLLGDYATARELQARTFTMQRQAESKSSTVNILSSWNGLARVVRLNGEYREACDIGQDAYEFGVQQLGAEHPWTLRVAKDLSIARRRAGLVEESLELASHTFELQTRGWGVDHPDTLASALCLANAQRAFGQTSEALELIEDITARYPRMYGDSHPFKYGCDSNYALMLRVNGDAERARVIDEAALEGYDRVLTREHHFTLTCVINLASDLATLGEVEQARMLGEDTLGKLRVLLGEDHPLTLAGAANLAIDLRVLGDDERADVLWEDTVARYTRVLGAEHPDVRVMRANQRLDFDFDPPAL